MLNEELPILLHNSVRDWLFAGGTAFLVAFLFRQIQWFAARRVGEFRQRRDSAWLEGAERMLRGVRLAFWIAVAITVAARTLLLPAPVHHFLHITVLLLVLMQAGLSLSGMIGYLAEFALRKSPEDGSRTTTVRAITFVGRLLLFVTLLLLGLDNVGVNVTAVLAGLGVGGIAVALAVQKILGDFIASLTIVLDRPFVIGDAIAVGDCNGTIEEIGLRTTRIRSISGEQLIYPNAELLQSRIRNFKRMRERRVVFSFGVAYETPIDVLAQLAGEVRTIVESQEQTRFERCHFAVLGASSLDYELVYWMRTPDYVAYMATREKIQLAMLRRFAELGASFAYPTSVQYTYDGNALASTPPPKS